MAVTADDGIETVDVVIARLVSTLASTSTLAGFSVKPMWVRAMTTSLVGRRAVGKFLCLGDRVAEGQAGDIAGQLVVGHAVVADAQDGNIEYHRLTRSFQHRARYSRSLTKSIGNQSLR